MGFLVTYNLDQSSGGDDPHWYAITEGQVRKKLNSASELYSYAGPGLLKISLSKTDLSEFFKRMKKDSGLCVRTKRAMYRYQQ